MLSILHAIAAPAAPTLAMLSEAACRRVQPSFRARGEQLPGCEAVEAASWSWAMQASAAGGSELEFGHTVVSIDVVKASAALPCGFKSLH